MRKFALFKSFINIPKHQFTNMEGLSETNALLESLESKRFTRVPRKSKQNPVQISYENESSQSNSQPTKEPPMLRHSQTLKDPKELDMRSRFDEIYSKLLKMREKKDAPVDTMGVFYLPDPNADTDTRNFQMLVALILSVQTKDQTTHMAMTRLKEYGLTVEKMYEVDSEKLKQLIFECNFNATKVKNIKSIARMLKEETNGKLPNDLDGLLKLPGVGKKIAFLYLQGAHNKVDGIAVDTHVHRISNRLGLVKTKMPEETRVELQSFVKKELWGEVNEILVGFGQQTCLPIRPRCGECLLNDICPEGKKNMLLLSNEKKPKKAKTMDVVLNSVEESAEENSKTIAVEERKVSKKVTVKRSSTKEKISKAE